VLMVAMLRRGRTMGFVKTFIADIKGATAVEYGLLAAVISVAILASIGAIGNNIGNLFLSTSNHLNIVN
jgi:pilus assembly protein Flp/PilA